MNKYYAMIAICSCCCCCYCCCYCFLSSEGILYTKLLNSECGLSIESGQPFAFCGPFKPHIIWWILLFCYLQQRCCCHVYKNILMPVCDFHEINKNLHVCVVCCQLLSVDVRLCCCCCCSCRTRFVVLVWLKANLI